MPLPLKNRVQVIPPSTDKLQETRASQWGFNPIDATKALQDAINSGAHKVIVENMGNPWLIRPIKLAADQEIIFEKGVVLQAVKGSFQSPNDCMFTALQISNLKLTGQGTVIRMLRRDYENPSYQRGEWRHLIRVLSCSNVEISGLRLEDSGGDGVYLGEVPGGGPPNAQISIRNVTCNNNYRIGIAVISVIGLLIDNCDLLNANGTSPMSGIDFEPNTSKQVLLNCVVRNCRVNNNKGGGVMLSLGNLNNKSTPVSIRFEDCQIFDNKWNLTFWIKRSEPVAGSVHFVRCEFDKTPMVYAFPRQFAVTFEHCQIVSKTPDGKQHAPIPLMNFDYTTINLNNK